jgi:hypothetical protein
MGQVSAALADSTQEVNRDWRREAARAVATGGRLVVYEICISLVFITLRRPTGVKILRPGERGIVRGLPYSLVSLVLGWWGLPWGVIYTPLTILTNLRGGFDVTNQFREDLLQFMDEAKDSAAAPAS